MLLIHYKIKSKLIEKTLGQRLKIYIAGHRDLVGSAIMWKLKSERYTNIITRTHSELDLTRQTEIEDIFEDERPKYIFFLLLKLA